MLNLVALNVVALNLVFGLSGEKCFCLVKRAEIGERCLHKWTEQVGEMSQSNPDILVKYPIERYELINK